MQITVEISLYPFTENYAPIIEDFINRLKSYADIEVLVNATSTQLVGEHSHLFDILKKETEKSFQENKSLFVIKLLGFERDLRKYVKEAKS